MYMRRCKVLDTVDTSSLGLCLVKGLKRVAFRGKYIHNFQIPACSHGTKVLACSLSFATGPSRSFSA